MIPSPAFSRRFLLAGAVALAALGTAPSISAQEAQRGGTLVVASVQKPRHLNAAVQSGIATAVPAAQIFATLLRYGEDFEPQPYLAESWSFSEDSKVLTLKLRSGATFHDGQPITAEDVIWSLGVVKENHPFSSMLAPAETFEAPDQQTVVIRMTQPHPAILLVLSSALTPIMPKHVFDDGQDIKSNPKNNMPVGSGPFKVTAFEPGQHIILERHDGFFLKDRPYLDRIVIRQYQDPNSAVLALESGEAQLFPMLDSTRLIRRLEKSSSLTISDQGYAGIGPVNWLAFNTKHPALSDVRVRRAIAYAIDRNFITKALHSGLSKPAIEPVVRDSPFFTEEVERYDFDLDKAKALLTEAGFGEGGQTLKLRIDYLPDTDEQQRSVAEYVKAALAKAGVEVSVRASPDFPTWAQRVSSYDFDMTMDLVFNWGDPVIGVNRTYLCSNIRQGIIWSNTQQYCNEEVDQLLNAAGDEPDLTKRKQLYAQAFGQITADIPIHFLNEIPYHTVWSQAVQNPPISIWGAMGPMDEVWLKQ
ncbi:ABC transporter substrate-binding protein [Paracoccus kondratievae]|uniref:ABC transporter substrate-binding protein n=1 Tax=Paracoccus kondratievae TaxID=135740 RepID=A0AAD3P2K2_9RHOB|nr:ABC transporter substrate-binding protein [Paracoccus kondratievae]QFQ88560.1 ABC transporter substrate-binding protein [Paracoccus kondratievae]GLK65705.1 ABC transporter substrate-binding protein [Paracoccus kondratievae]